jgi:hypothetical protein
MLPRSRTVLALLATLTAAGLGACVGTPGQAPGTDAGLPPPLDVPAATDLPVVADATEPVVAGFITLDGVRSGVAPLRVTFLPVTRGVVTTYRWEFGDATAPDSTSAPEHLYVLPGSYQVSLAVSGPGGSDSLEVDDYIQVLPAPTGSPCSTDDQCAGSVCLCGGDDTGCPSSLLAGVCSHLCQSDECPSGTICVDLGRSVGTVSPTVSAAMPPVPAPWQQPVCLPACSRDSDCTRSGFHCRALPAVDPTNPTADVNACLSGDPRAVGRPCAELPLTEVGSPQAGCAFGLCLDYGLAGLCSAPCHSNRDCPPDTACAHFQNMPDGDGACLLRCDSPGLCPTAPGDPLLGCELPGGPGPDGFVLTDTGTPTGRFCSPRRCRDDSECVLGLCTDGICQQPPPGDGGPSDGGDGPGGDAPDGGDAGDLGADMTPDAPAKDLLPDLLPKG